MNMQVKCPPVIDMAEVDDLRRALNKGYDNVDLETLKLITEMCLTALRKVHWNEYNEQRFGRKPVTVDEVIFLPSLPPHPKPFRSWPEVHIGLFGGLKDLEYEPKSHKVSYIVEHTYQPDWVDASNDRIFYEAKGIIPTQADAAKYRSVADCNDVHFVFILQERNIICPFARPRKDGSRMTHEEWVKNQKFDYCYQGEEAEFLKSARYKYLVENFGKGLPRLEETLRTTKKK